MMHVVMHFVVERLSQLKMRDVLCTTTASSEVILNSIHQSMHKIAVLHAVLFRSLFPAICDGAEVSDKVADNDKFDIDEFPASNVGPHGHGGLGCLVDDQPKRSCMFEFLEEMGKGFAALQKGFGCMADEFLGSRLFRHSWN